MEFSVIEPDKDRVPAPIILDVPVPVVVIEANVLAASIFNVPPALIVIVLFTGIVLAATVLPFGIVVCAFAQQASIKKEMNKKKNFKKSRR